MTLRLQVPILQVVLVLLIASDEFLSSYCSFIEPVDLTIHRLFFLPEAVKFLRHYFCFYLLNQGVDHITVATLSGHRDVNILKERYGHLTDDTLRKAMKLFDGCSQLANYGREKPLNSL